MSLTQDGIGPVQLRKRFIEVIRESVCSRIEFEDELPPPPPPPHLMPCGATGSEPVVSRTCAIRLPVIRVLYLTQYDWKIVDGKLECDWGSVGNTEAVRQVGIPFQSCSSSCVTACSTRRCSCQVGQQVWSQL